MQQYNITELRFGRNIGTTQQMDPQTWNRFQADAVAALEWFALSVHAPKSWTEVHTGTGTWTDEETGVTVVEESAVVTLYWSDGSSVTTALRILELDASILARNFQQDAVAVVHGGRSTLVKAQLEEVAR